MLHKCFPQYLLLFRMPTSSLIRVDAMQRLVDDQGRVLYYYFNFMGGFVCFFTFYHFNCIFIFQLLTFNVILY